MWETVFRVAAACCMYIYANASDDARSLVVTAKVVGRIRAVHLAPPPSRNEDKEPACRGGGAACLASGESWKFNTCAHSSPFSPRALDIGGALPFVDYRSKGNREIAGKTQPYRGHAPRSSTIRFTSYRVNLRAEVRLVACLAGV